MGLDSLALRPQLLGAFLFAGSMWMLVNRSRRPALAWALPVITVAWANVHGSFALAPLLPILAWVKDRLAGRTRSNRLVAVAVICALGTFINPWGPSVWGYAVDIATDPNIRRLVTEWAPTTPTDWGGVAFRVSVTGALGWIGWRGRREGNVAWSLVPWLVVFAAMAVASARGTLWWALAAPVTLAPLAASRQALASASRRLNTLFLAGLATLGVVLLPWWRSEASLLRDAPAGLSAAAETALPPGSRLSTPQRWASWFELKAPSLPVMVDSRIELFPGGVWDDFEQIQRGGDRALVLLGDYEVDGVVLDRTQIDLRASLEAAGWKLVVEDPDGALFRIERPD